MPRIIKIAVDGSITDVEIESFEYPHLNTLLGEGRMIERVKVGRLTDWFPRVTHDHADSVQPVLIVDESGRVDGLPVNENATRLYAPQPERHRYMISGDVYVVGEGQTREGLDFVDLPEQVTVEKVAELVALFEDH